MKYNFKEAEKAYKAEQEIRKSKIRQEPNKWKKFFRYLLYLFLFPFHWLKLNIKDFWTAIIFAIVVVIMSSTVWFPYLIGVITKDKVWIAVGSASWLFWLGPGTPFLLLSIFITISIKALINKWRTRGEKNDRRNKTNR